MHRVTQEVKPWQHRNKPVRDGRGVNTFAGLPKISQLFPHQIGWLNTLSRNHHLLASSSSSVLSGQGSEEVVTEFIHSLPHRIILESNHSVTIKVRFVTIVRECGFIKWSALLRRRDGGTSKLRHVWNPLMCQDMLQPKISIVNTKTNKRLILQMASTLRRSMQWTTCSSYK